MLQILVIFIITLYSSCLFNSEGHKYEGVLPYNHSVKVFHFIVHHWGESRKGLQECGNIRCEWTHSDHLKNLRDNLHETNLTEHGIPTTTLSLYNIHYWWEKTRDTKPAICDLRTNLTMAETEESKIRYFQLFDQSFKHFDGYSSTHTSSAVPRVYIEAFLNNSNFLAMRNFSSMIKGGSYVASDCHKRDSANANRDSYVHQIRLHDFRIDGLGRCMHSNTGPEGISLPKTRDTRYNLYLKRETIGHFLFNMAFENSLEPGYVTEKPFDALVSGTVPVYLGDATHLKSLLPHPKAAIFISDFSNISSLVNYLNYLTKNETAYEEHRAWRHDFNYYNNIKNKPLLATSWFCRVCQWAVEESKVHHKRTKICPNTTDPVPLKRVKAPSDWYNKAVRSNNQRQVYYVKNGILQGIPDLNTFTSLKLDLEKIIVISEHELNKYIIGDLLPSNSTP